MADPAVVRIVKFHLLLMTAPLVMRSCPLPMARVLGPMPLPKLAKVRAKAKANSETPMLLAKARAREKAKPRARPEMIAAAVRGALARKEERPMAPISLLEVASSDPHFRLLPMARGITVPMAKVEKALPMARVGNALPMARVVSAMPMAKVLAAPMAPPRARDAARAEALVLLPVSSRPPGSRA